MSILLNRKYKCVLVTARCSYYTPFRSLQYNIPPSTTKTDNVRVESTLRNSKRVQYFCNRSPYTYTRDMDGKLYEFVEH